MHHCLVYGVLVKCYHQHPSYVLYLCNLPKITNLAFYWLENYKVDHAVSSAIYFLLLAGEITRLHCIPGETCHYYTGEPSQSENLPTNKSCLSFSKDHDDGQVKMTVVGPDLRKGQRSQYTVAQNVWFGAFLTHDTESFTDDYSVFVKTPGRGPDPHYSFVGDDEMATRDGMLILAPNMEAFINYLVPA
ncbi:hypothetical protein VPH35_121795 [Triticum aestivum]